MSSGVRQERARALPGVLWRGALLLRRQTWSSRLEYIMVLLVACVTEIAVRVVPLDRLARLYGLRLSSKLRSEPSPLITDLPPWAIRRYRVVLTVMKRWPVDGECLRRGLVLGQRLRSCDPELKLGVRREDTGVVAHAWLEIDGHSLDPTSDQYQELPPVAR